MTLSRTARRAAPQRRGILVVLTGFCLCVVFAFVALSVDSGRIVLTETEMQNAVDAAALAASQEIQAAVHAAGQGEGSANIDSNSIAVSAARTVAADVAARNGVFIDPGVDVHFGKRSYDEATDTWPIEWGGSPVNVVRVAARRTGSNTAAADGEFPLTFGWAVGRESVPLTTSATAFIEARDLVLVLDFSGSMSDDSEFRSIGTFAQADVEASLDEIYDTLLESGVTWPNHPSREKFQTAYGAIDSYAGTYVSSSYTSTIFNTLGLGEKYPSNHPDYPGQLKYPYPQAGRYSSGTPRNMPSESSSRSKWEGYINYVKNLNGPYNKKYGYRSLVNYMLQNNQMKWTKSEDLWRTPHYPFHAVKNGASLFLGYLNELDFWGRNWSS